MKLYTSRYQEKSLAGREDLVKVRTTVGTPRFALGYPMEFCGLIAPYGAFGKPNWQELYWARLNDKGVTAIREALETISERHDGRDLVLLCYEDVLKDGDDVCHRRHFAAFWELNTGEVVRELDRDGPVAQLPAPEGVTVQTTLDL